MSFQKIMIAIAIILLVLFAMFLFYSLKNSHYNVKFPPRVAQCPNYYGPSSDNKYKCYDNLNLTTTPDCKIADNKTTITERCSWISECKVGWDGLNSTICNKKK